MLFINYCSVKPQTKVIIISFIIFVAIFIIVASFGLLFINGRKPLTAGIITVVTSGITMIIAPRTKKIILQSGEKIIITNDLFNFFKNNKSKK